MKIADISVYQGNIDWEKARQELEMVIFRASIGEKKDTKYIQNAKNCKIPFGVYHYFKAGTKEEAEKEARFFYAAATQDSLKPLFFCLDIEYKTQTSKTTKIICETALNTLKKMGAKKVGLYIGQSRYHYIKDIKDKFDFLWIPRYGKNTGLMDINYKPIYVCDMWQYTSKGRVNGIIGNVDLNVLCSEKTLDWYKSETTPQINKIVFYYLGRRVIRIGNQGRDVQELQTRLKQLGYDCGKIDGKFGEKTKKALKAFQKKNKLTVDGICGKKTISKLIG